MTGYGCISFTTDYGLADGFVAACHGVALSIAPSVRLVDITHAVPPGDVRRGAHVLAQTAPYLPRPSVHVAVVDPGVGTARRAIAVEAAGGVLVGPDNGLLLPAAEALGGAIRVHELTNEELFRRPVSATFHGRDVFMPVAAHLAQGVDLAAAGPEVAVNDLVRLPEPVLRTGDGWLETEVLTVDRFGNLQLAAAANQVPLGAIVQVSVGAGPAYPAALGRTFGSVEPGGLVIYADSAGRLALAVNGGSAAERLGASAGETIRLATR